jgi:Leucine-rich repeat (LRR) protein
MSIKTSRWQETTSSHNEKGKPQKIPVVWPRLEVLNLSYNRIPVTSISYLGHFGVGADGGCLRELDLSGNGLTHLPEDMSFLRSLEVLNLSHN